MAFHFADKRPLRVRKVEYSGIVSRTYDESVREDFADLFVQYFDSLEINRFIDVVMQMQKQGVHQCLFNRVHFLASSRLNIPFTIVCKIDEF